MYRTWSIRRALTRAIFMTTASLLTNCAPHTWTPGPGVNLANFERTKAQCSLMARHGGGSFAAFGSPSFVAGAALGNAIGESVRMQQDFNDCMVMNGWLIADQTSSTAQDNATSQRTTIVTADAHERASLAAISSCKDAFYDYPSHFKMSTFDNDYDKCVAETTKQLDSRM